MKHCATCKDRPSEHAEAWATGGATPCDLCRIFDEPPSHHVEFKEAIHRRQPESGRPTLMVDPFVWDRLTDSQKALAQVMADNPRETQVEWAKILGISKQAVHAGVERLRRKVRKITK